MLDSPLDKSRQVVHVVLGHGAGKQRACSQGSYVCLSGYVRWELGEGGRHGDVQLVPRPSRLYALG